MMMKSPMSSYKNMIAAVLFRIIMLSCFVFQALVFADKAAVSATCIPKERRALLQFKAALVDSYGMLSSWGTVDDCCKWDRVSCNNLTGHVLSLHLQADVNIIYERGREEGYELLAYLRGEIHTSLIELQQLQYLNLSSNAFESIQIPEFFGSLSNLRYLDLSYCDFTGEIPTQFGSLSRLKYLNLRANGLHVSIPYQLGNLSKLQYLDLSDNYLQGTIPSQLANLSSLQELYLGSYNSALKIEGGSHQWLSSLTSLTHLDLSGVLNLNTSHSCLQMIGKLSKLRELKLSGCSLSDHSILSFPPWSSKFNFSTSLSILDLSYNTFTSPTIFQWLSNVTFNLVELDLSGNLLERSSTSNNFDPPMTSHLEVMIGMLPKLRKLWLSDCNLSDHFLVSLTPSKFNFSTSLSVLDLSDNRLKGGELKSFANMCTLRSLDVSRNNLSEDLPSILHSLSIGCVGHSLQELYLSDNQIIGTLSDLSMFSSLKTFDLSMNHLSGKIPEECRLSSQMESLSIHSNILEGGIPRSFGNTCTLSLLDLSNNSLSVEFPLIIRHLSGCARYSLEELYLDMNRINDTVPDLSMFSALRSLYLSENQLNGNFSEKSRLPSMLENLSVGSNSLNGVINESYFANVSKLRELDFSYNSVNIVFSQNWVPPFQLEYLSLRSCHLGPQFPKWLHTQNLLRGLDISKAGISDIVPEWFWSKLGSNGFESIDISCNNLTGVIPNLSIRNRGYFLSLASNQFEGPIPEFLRGAIFLDLSKNKFSDSYSFVCTNGTSETLDKLDLSNNKLSGQIPDCWNHFESLAYLDLSHNNFSGKIPDSVGSLSELQALILRNNSLSEEIPFSMQNCTRLAMLDATENKLSGHIPSWIGSRLQELQILSLQRNHFFGSLPLQLCYLKHIQLVDLSFNNLSGQVPKCIKNLTSLAQKTSLTSSESFHHIYQVFTNFLSGAQYIDLNAFLMWKGAEHMFNNKVLSLLKSIDLSSNQLSGEIPTEIEDLLGLVSLNLSRNNFTGEIPSNIGRLTSLDFLDLSRNQLSGPIPSSLTQIDRLSILDVSHNHLSGRIPTGTQLQSFDPWRYEDNPDLCGKPLEKLCIEGEAPQEQATVKSHDEEAVFANAFFMSMGFGFAMGFWGIYGSILAKRSWRHAYFRFMSNLTDDIYVFIAVKVAKYKRWLRG